MKYTSKQNYTINNQVDKRFLFQSVAAKFKGTIHKSHVVSVLNLLIAEISKELEKGNEIKIGNFITLLITNSKPRKHWDLIAGKVKVAKGKKKLRIKLNRKLKKELNKFFGDLK